MTSILYLATIIIICVFLTIATEIEWFGWTTLTIIGSVVAVQFFHIFNIWLYAKDHLIQSIIYTIGYIAIGIIWSFAKWLFFLVNQRDLDRALFERNKREEYNYISSIPTINIPQVSDNKSRIIAWMTFWPWSLIGTILNDPFRKLFSFIFSQFKNSYQALANNIYKNDIAKLEQIKIEYLQKIKISNTKED